MKEKISVKKTKKEAITAVGLHCLRAPRGAHTPRKIKGRGPSSGHGKTSTRGSKGQTSRSGRATYPGFEGGQMPLIRKVPKRGFVSTFKKEFQIVKVKDLARVKTQPVTPELLEAEGLIKDATRPVKLLGDGEIAAAISVKVHAVSNSAAQKIKNAGGKVELLNV